MTIFLAGQLPAYAQDAYDLGNVQVVGDNAQQEEMKPSPGEISREMGEKAEFLPEFPEVSTISKTTLKEKPFEPSPAGKKISKRLTVELGKGSSDAFYGSLAGKGVYNDYEGKFEMLRETKDGFRSQSDDRKTEVTGSLKSFGDGKYEVKAEGGYLTDHFGQRGTRVNPTPTAGINDTASRFSVKGNSTTQEGAFITGLVAVESQKREIVHPIKNFREEGEHYSGLVQGEYLKSINKDFQAKATLGINKNSYAIDNGPDSDNTKQVLGLSGEYNFHEKAFLELGGKNIALMGTNRTVPALRLSYHWSKPWQAILSYDEDLRNENLKEAFLGRRYIPVVALKASHQKRMSGKLNYRWEDGNTLGVELFQEKERDALEYLDRQDLTNGLLISDIRHAGEASRKGLTIGGHVRLDDNFTLGAASTIQDPEDSSTGKQLAYEAKKILDVLFSFRSGAFEADYTRKAYFDRVAYVPAVQVNPGDYSRADLFFKYHFKKDIRAFLKVKDLYDDAKSLRYDVPEEGRVSIVGLEADF
jgi:hypothetical protein